MYDKSTVLIIVGSITDVGFTFGVRSDVRGTVEGLFTKEEVTKSVADSFEVCCEF